MMVKGKMTITTFKMEQEALTVAGIFTEGHQFSSVTLDPTNKRFKRMLILIILRKLFQNASSELCFRFFFFIGSVFVL